MPTASSVFSDTPGTISTNKSLTQKPMKITETTDLLFSKKKSIYQRHRSRYIYHVKSVHSQILSRTTCGGASGGGMLARLKHVHYRESDISRVDAAFKCGCRLVNNLDLVTMQTDTKKCQPVSESRKIRKPLMEKKRRARINDSLETLKQILLESRTTLKESRGKNGQRTAKLEKADILEMTVSYLQHLHAKLNEIKEKNTGEGNVRVKDSCVTLIPTKLGSGEVVYFLPSNLGGNQKRHVEKLSRPVKPESVWRPW